jgi:hypothetical protein
MRCNKILPLVALLGAVACGDDSGTGSPGFQYNLAPASPTVSVGQDSTVSLGITVTRGTDPVTGARLSYSSADYRIATVDSIGRVTARAGGATTITARLGNSTVDIPVTVRPHPADSLELTILTGPAGGFKSVRADTGTFYALPADPATSRLRAIVRVGNDTVFCNYCQPKATARVQRQVRFVSLNPELARVSNANNPLLQTSTDTSGRVTPLDTSATGVRIVMEVPGDSGVAAKWKDTVLVKFSLRPLDSLRVRPDSNLFPTTNGTGLQKQIYPDADSVQANVRASANTNFIAGLDFLSRVQDVPQPTVTNANPALPNPRYIVARVAAPGTNPLVRRPSLPNVFWESANTGYLSVNAAGSVTGRCAFIGGDCPVPPSPALPSTWLIRCTSTSGPMPATFGGLGTYTIPSCATTTTIPMPGAFCTSTNSSDLNSTCTVYIRATAIDPVTGKVLRALYRINILTRR